MKKLFYFLMFVLLSFYSRICLAQEYWAYSYFTGFNNVLSNLSPTADNGYVLAGYSELPPPDVFPLPTMRDLLIIKLDSLGQIQSQKNFSGADWDEAELILQTIDGGYIVSGVTFSYGNESGNVWVLKLDNNLNIEWQKVYEGMHNDWTYGMTGLLQEIDGSYVLSGNGYLQPCWIMKINSNGNVVWAKEYNFSASKLGKTSDGGFVMSGRTPTETPDDFLVVKLDFNGDISWATSYGGAQEDSANSIKQTNDGGYILVGDTQSFGVGYSDVWVLKLGVLGNVQWQKSFGTIDLDTGRDVLQTNDSGYLINCWTNYGGGDGFLLKLNRFGQTDWIISRQLFSILQNSDGSFILGGSIDPSDNNALSAPNNILLVHMDESGLIPDCSFFDDKFGFPIINPITTTSTNTISASYNGLSSSAISLSVMDTTSIPVASSLEILDLCDDNTGSNGYPCYEDETCDSGLICLDDICTPIENDRLYKAIIVAGGGPYMGNTLWGATQFVSQYAYKILDYQGFNNDSIYFMGDMIIDLDENGLFDDVDGDATNANLEYAIKTWAADADDVLIFITDHGGKEYFKMGRLEELFAEDLNSWIDEMQQTVDGTVTVIYDACESGSFIPKLKSLTGKERIVITSSSHEEEAFFLSSGSISFSFYFWSQVLTGATLYDSFLLARNAMETHQTPCIDDNGNGTPNEENIDGILAKTHTIGVGLVGAADFPIIGSISSDHTLTGSPSATIWVDNVVPSNNISRVWAVVIPPNFISEDTSIPIIDLPSFELNNVSGTKYEGTYSGFTVAGTYRVSVYAKDIDGNMAIPLSTNIIQMTDAACPLTILLGGSSENTTMMRSFRDNVLLKSSGGAKLVDLYYRHAFELLLIMILNPEIMELSKILLDCIIPEVEMMVENRKIGVFDDSEEINELLDLVAESASPELKRDIVNLKKTMCSKTAYEK